MSAFDIIGAQRTWRWGPVQVSFGTVHVHTQVTSFLRRLPSGEVIGTHPLDLPLRTLNTRAVWWTMPVEWLEAAGVGEVDIPGSAHAAEHAGIGMLPLVATCDRWDIGGVSTALHPDTGLPTIMVYDGHPGGAGFAERAFESFEEWLRVDPRDGRAVPLRERLPGLRAVAQVRQRQRAPGQGGSNPAAAGGAAPAPRTGRPGRCGQPVR